MQKWSWGVTYRKNQDLKEPSMEYIETGHTDSLESAIENAQKVAEESKCVIVFLTFTRLE